MTETTTDRRSILAAGLALLTMKFGGVKTEEPTNEEPPADVILNEAQRKEKLRNWFKKHIAKSKPVDFIIIHGGQWRVMGELLLADGSVKQMCVGFDEGETQEQADEFYEQFNLNITKYCPDLVPPAVWDEA